MIRRTFAPVLAALTLATTTAMPMAASAAPSPKALERRVEFAAAACIMGLAPDICVRIFENWIQKFFP